LEHQRRYAGKRGVELEFNEACLLISDGGTKAGGLMAGAKRRVDVGLAKFTAVDLRKWANCGSGNHGPLSCANDFD
jgi:hypothetical protein